MTEEQPLYTNALSLETSPYLLQHAHNPVNWYPWNDQVLQKARDEDKLLLISIGYSSCHWCHVMERECFEDEDIASLMNIHFINIKVDREERPDIDQVYMHAVQLMTGSGGWPLNCIALPDGRPLYGGTYFPKHKWQQVLLQVSSFYRRDKARCIQYADELASEVNRPFRVMDQDPGFSFTTYMADQVYDRWKEHFDWIEGGPDRTPKFPLPGNFEFLLQYYYHTGNIKCLEYIRLSLGKMAYGGIYDQVGGGFSRYSTDAIWKVPHFEKMLYDNAQLVSIYSKAWIVTGNELFRQVVYETLEFIGREMTGPDGGFYSALDADSEGEEGKFYVWTSEEINLLLGKEAGLFSDYFNVNEYGFWEHGNYILLRRKKDEHIAAEWHLELNDLQDKINAGKKILLQKRMQRKLPGLDDKILVSWNAMMVIGYVDAYHAFGEKKFLDVAENNMMLMENVCRKPDGGLFHTFKSGKPKINGFLEDYCFYIKALISLYEATFREEFLENARKLIACCISQFYNHETGLFYFTGSSDTPLLTRKYELEDNVIASSNAVMAEVLFKIAAWYPNENFREMSAKMLHYVLPDLLKYGSAYSQWGIVLLMHAYPFYEVVVTGPQALLMASKIRDKYLPDKILSASTGSGNLEIFKKRVKEKETLIYVCRNNSCLLPVKDIESCLKLIRGE